jgi:hypothetical protein
MSFPTVFSKQNGLLSCDYISFIIWGVFTLNNNKEMVLLEQLMLLIINN